MREERDVLVKEAVVLHEEEERIRRQLGNLQSLQISLGIQAGIQSKRGQPKEAMTLLMEKERICRQIGNPEGLSRSLINQAMILIDYKPESAIPLADEALRLPENHGLVALVDLMKPLVDHFHGR